MRPTTLPAPAVPHGAKFDADATIMENARSAWDAQKTLNRSQRERNARVAARRIFRTDEIEFDYQAVTGQDNPSFTIEDELIVYLPGQRGEVFSLVEICGGCGKDWKGRAFFSLAELGKRIDERDEDQPFVCADCRVAESFKSRGRK